jgi:cytochrome P450
MWHSDEMKDLPQAPYFDAGRGVWVLTRFSDVSAALHEPDLWPVAPNGEGQLDDAGRTAQGKNRSEVLAALHAAKIAEWRAEFSPLAAAIATALPADRVIEVVGEFARPWSLLLAAKVVGIEVDQARRLEPLAASVTSSTAAPENVALKADASVAGAELDQAFVNSRLPMAGPAFIALSQTLPCLLANAWLILLNHAAEMEQIAAKPELLPRAVDELLRLAGLARVVHRQAIADVNLGHISFAQGQRVDLMLDVANYDPEQFPNPEDLDLTRRSAGHFAMGAGDHSCVAASLIRMAMGIATGVFIEKFVPADRTDPVDWLGGSGFRWPAAVYARNRGED